MSELDYLDHGRVILPTNADPAIVCVEGYERFYLGLDLGRSDPTALVLLRDRQLPEWSTPLRQHAQATDAHRRLCGPHTGDGLYRHREPCGLHTLEI